MYPMSVVQNENVNRSSTSEARVQDLRRPERRTPMSVASEEEVWFCGTAMGDVC